MFGLRAARMVFRSRSSPVSITLFPLIHVGDKCFYDEIYKDAFSHDVVLVEGIDSPTSRNLTRSYRWINFENLDLVLQPRAPTQESVRSRIIHADLSATEFEKLWKTIPIYLRITLFVAPIILGVYRKLFATRASISSKMCLEDRLSSDEILNWDLSIESLNDSLLYARDSQLLKCMAEEIIGPGEKTIAIVYGALHMRAVIRELTTRNFRCAEARWQTIISP